MFVFQRCFTNDMDSLMGLDYFPSDLYIFLSTWIFQCKDLIGLDLGSFFGNKLFISLFHLISGAKTNCESLL